MTSPKRGVSLPCAVASFLITTLIAPTVATLTSSATAAPAPKPRPAVIEGVVTRVFDGDSLLRQPALPALSLQVRLMHIDAPEICQNWGAQSRAALAALLLDKPVSVHTVARDRYGRVVGRVTVDGVDASVAQVEAGHAWSARTKWDQGPLVKQERMAKALARGLHSELRPQMPKAFRASNCPCPH